MHEFAEHVAAVKKAHELDPDTVYPELHVGWHVDPLASELVQSPAPPFVGAVDASHGFAEHVAARRYRMMSPTPCTPSYTSAGKSTRSPRSWCSRRRHRSWELQTRRMASKSTSLRSVSLLCKSSSQRLRTPSCTWLARRRRSPGPCSRQQPHLWEL